MKKLVVIIGSGAAGLGAAAYLASSDYHVTLVEQGRELGGFLNPFKRKHYDFDPGVHYVGECQPGGMIHNFYKGLGLDAEEAFVELDPDGFDHFHFPDFELKMCRGREEYRDRLAQRFPHDVASVDRFFTVLRRFQRSFTTALRLTRSRPKWGDLRALSGVPSLLKYGRATYADLLKATVRDPKLRAILAAQGGDYGLPPSKASAIVGLTLVGHYLNGAYFPKGGSRKMRDDLVAVAKSNENLTIYLWRSNCRRRNDPGRCRDLNGGSDGDFRLYDR